MAQNENCGEHFNIVIDDNNVILCGIDPADEIMTIHWCFPPAYIHEVQQEHFLNKLTASYAPAIYEKLEWEGKNEYKGKTIVSKSIENDWEIYHFHFGLKIQASGYPTLANKSAFPHAFGASFRVVGDKDFAKTQIRTRERYWKGRDYKCFFYKPLKIECSFFERVNFKYCEFFDDVIIGVFHDLEEKYEFHNGLNFESCTFHKDVIFPNLLSGTKDGKNPLSWNARETTFRNCKFLGNVDFSNSEFVTKIFFDNAEFQGRTNFEGCQFEKNISFSNAIFQSLPIFSQAEFKEKAIFVNTKLKFSYEMAQENIKEYTQIKESSSTEARANIFRDSARLIKNTLSKEGNLLDASNYHRVELYCKEIELDSKLKESWNWRDWIDKWQLRLYRHTSDHHTDLLKIISWVLVAIGIFGLLLFACKYGTNLKTFIDNHSKNAFVALFDIPIITQNKIVIWFVYALGFFSLFWKWSRIFFFSSIALCVAYCKPTLIFGAMNLIDKTPRSGVENLLLVIYTLAMILLIFSLQKTARKNSIVPN